MATSLRVGVIGTSRWTDAMFLTSLSSHPRARITAVCGRSYDRAAEMAEKYAIPQIYSDYRQLINDTGVDAVVVAAPDDLHYEMTMAAIETGKHVLCEKPLALNADQAQEMFTAADGRQLKHMVLFTWRWQPHFLFVKRLIDDNFIGRCYQADFYFMGGWGFDRVYRWRTDSRRTARMVADLGSHMIDLARWYLGEAAGVTALLDTFARLPEPPDPEFVQANDAASFLLKMASGTQVVIRVSGVAHRGDREVDMGLRLYGENGALEIDYIFDGPNAGAAVRGMRSGDKRFRALEIPTDLTSDLDLSNPFDPYTKRSAGPRHFVDAILNNQPTSPDFFHGWQVQRVVDAAVRSNKEKRWVWLG